MTDYSDPLFQKLDRIPAAPNFVRYNFEELPRTLKAFVAFAKGMPRISYVEGLKIIKDLVLGLIDAAQALKAADKLRESPSKEAIIEFVKAFCSYAETRQYVATPAYAEFVASFPIARELFIPVKPMLVAREGGQLKPIFVFGWKTVALTLFQRRLLMTILEDAIFSLTDFEYSDAEIVFLPEIDGIRTAEVWRRGDYELLPRSKLKNQIELFLTARSKAYPLIAEWLMAKGTVQSEPPATYEDPRQIRLDLPPPGPHGK